ncbi:hypothetical protein Tco_0931310 [Tanacetum coccineum]
MGFWLYDFLVIDLVGFLTLKNLFSLWLKEKIEKLRVEVMMNPSSMFSAVESTCPTTAIDCFDELTRKIWQLFVAMTVQGVKQQTAAARRLQQQVDSMFLLFVEVRVWRKE